MEGRFLSMILVPNRDAIQEEKRGLESRLDSERSGVATDLRKAEQMTGRVEARLTTATERIAEHEDSIGRLTAELAEAHRLPLVTGLPFGHVDANRPWTLGARAVLDGDRGTLEQLESGVSQRS